MTDLEKLSHKEIRELWQATTERARKQEAEKRENAINEPNHDDGYYKDAFGNVIEGPALSAKTIAITLTPPDT